MKIYSADLISGSLSGSFTGLITSASHALTASYIEGGGGGGDAFPYTGSAGIQGTLDVTGDITSTQGGLTLDAGNISVDGSITANGMSGVIISNGNITSTTGDIVSTAGAVTANGNITSNTGDIVSTTGAVTADGNITSNNGNIISSNGDIISSNGAITADGNITSTQGNLTVSAGTITADGNITATTGDITSTTGAVTADGNITSNTGNIISSTGNIEASTGNFSAPNGGLTVDQNIFSSNGGLTVDQDITTNNGVIQAFGNISSATGNIMADTGNITAATGNFNAPNGGIYVEQNIETNYGTLTSNNGGLTVETDIVSNTGNLTVDGNITSNNGIFTGDGSGLTNLPGGGGGGAAISSSAFDFQFISLERDMNYPLRYEGNNNSGGFTWYTDNQNIMPTGTAFSGNEGVDQNSQPPYPDRFAILKYQSRSYGSQGDILFNFFKKIGIEEDKFQYSNGVINLSEAILIELETPQGTSYSSRVRFLCSSIGYRFRSDSSFQDVEYWFGGTSQQSYGMGGGMTSYLSMLDKNDFILSESSGTYYDTNSVNPGDEYATAVYFKIALNPATATIGTEITAAGINVTNNMNINFTGYASSPYSDFAVVEGFQDSGFGEYPFLGEFRDRLYNGAVFDRIEFIDDNGDHQIFEDEWVVSMGENPYIRYNQQEIKLISKTLRNNLTSTTGTSYNLLNGVQQSSLFIIGQFDQIIPQNREINGMTKYGGNNQFPFPVTRNQASVSKIKLTGDIEGQGDAHFTGDFKANSLEGGAINSEDVGTLYNKFTTENALSLSAFERLESNSSFVNNMPYIGWFDSSQASVSYYNLYQNAGYDSNNAQGYSDFAYFEMGGFKGVGMVDETISPFLKNLGIDTSTLTSSHHLFTFRTPIWITIKNSQANSSDSFSVKVAVSTILLQEITGSPYNTKIYFGGNMKGDNGGGISLNDPTTMNSSYLPRFRHSDFDIEGKNVYGEWGNDQFLRLIVHNGPTTRIGATHLHSKGDGISSGEVIYKDYALPNSTINPDVYPDIDNSYNGGQRAKLRLSNLNNYMGNQPSLRSGDWFDRIEFTDFKTDTNNQPQVYVIEDVIWFVEMDPIGNSNEATLIAVDHEAPSIFIMNDGGQIEPWDNIVPGNIGFLGDLTEVRLSRGSKYGGTGQLEAGTGQLEVSGDSILQSNLYLPNLPTSDPGVAGMVYVSGAGNLKISFG